MKPSHYSFSTFTRYAPYIGAALRAYPKAIRVDVHDLSVETFAARFRDVRKAKFVYCYISPEIDEVLFEKHANELIVAMRDGYVIIGPREAVKVEEQKEKQRLGVSQPEALRFEGSPEDLLLLATLISHRCFPPLVFSIPRQTPEVLGKLKYFDVLVEDNDPDSARQRLL